MSATAQFPPFSFVPDSVSLPHIWDHNQKGDCINLDSTCLRVSYRGTGKEDADASAVIANRPIPAVCGLFYFEISIISKGRDGHIGIGMCFSSNSRSRLPGWDANSYGYHADDGFLFKGSSGVGGAIYGPTFTTGDVIGCCINFRRDTVFYTKNGIHLGIAFRDILASNSFHPCVGLRTPGECVEGNFGQNPFVFDFEGELRKEREAIVKESFSVPFASIRPHVPQMILQYLINYGYCKSANVFQSSMLQQSEKEKDTDLGDILLRRDVTQKIMNGDIQQATEMILKVHPDFIGKNKSLQFKFKYYRFIQLIQHHSHIEAIEYGRKHFSFEDPGVAEHQSILQDVFSLLAYPKPTESPVSYLFSSDFRKTLAEEVNGAILEFSGYARKCKLEQCVAKCRVVNEENIVAGGSGAALLDVSWLLKSEEGMEVV